MTPEVLRELRFRLGMHVGSEDYDFAVAFFLGVDFGNSFGVLPGFREWLIMRLEYGENLTWRALVLECAFPDGYRRRLDTADQNRQAFDTLFALLEEFFAVKRDTGLRGIYVKYQRWLEQQSWYGPSSHDFIE